jgi:DNA-binding NtrC family response regulator
MRALIVDGDSGMRQALAAIAGGLGLEVTDAATVFTASGHLAAEAYDLLVLSLLLPDGTGMDVVRAAHRLGCEAPFLLVTGAHDLDALPAAVGAVLGWDDLQEGALPTSFGP